MAITLRRQLNDAEKEEIIRREGRRCFANGHAIAESEPLHFDHIQAYAAGGETSLNNIAPMCGQHNKEKGTLSLYDFRTKLRLQSFFERGDRLTLKDLLSYLRENHEIERFGTPVHFKLTDTSIEVESPTSRFDSVLYVCPTTGWRYFYATLDVALIDSDDDRDDTIGLQPRYLIFDKVFDLFRHFQRHPVLQPSVGRTSQDRILLFDGQHKIAALLLNGRKQFECKVYVNPDLTLLNQTNIAAHDKFAQTRFYSSIMVLKLGSQFGADFDAYKNLEDNGNKSEQGFMEFLTNREGSTLSKAERNERFRSYLYNSVLEREDNKLSRLVSSGNRGSVEKPLTIDLLSKSILSSFLFREPVADNMATDAYKRDLEVMNVVFLMNTIDELALHAWNPKASKNDDGQRRLDRLIRSKSIMAWSEILCGAICGKLDIQDPDERVRPFYRELSDEDRKKIRHVVEQLVNWKRWRSPLDDEIERVLADNKVAVKTWMKDKGLTTGYLMGAPE